MADPIEDDGQDDWDGDAVEQSPEFSKRLGGVMNSAFWNPSRPGGNGWEAGPDYPPGACTYEVAAEWHNNALDDRDNFLDECARYRDYDELPKPLRDKIDVIERFNEVWFDMEQRAISHATEPLSFVPAGTIHLTDDEKRAAAEAIRLANEDGKPEIAKWFEDSMSTNPNAVRSVLTEMGIGHE